MTDSKSLVQAIKAEDKHKGHSGGLNGCPICARAQAPEQDDVDLLEELLGEAPPAQAEEPQPEQDPIKARLARILD